MTVALGFIHPGTVHTLFMDSVLGFLAHDSAERQLFSGYLTASSAYIPDARNKVCEMFLTKTKAEWLWFCDYDLVFDPLCLYALLDAANPVDRPIICGAYFTRFGADLAVRPCWMEQREDQEFVPVSEFTPGRIQECTVVGMGFTLIHRSVLEKMKEQYKDDPWHWFGHDAIGKDRCGEDVTFCHRARTCGFSVWGHGGVLLGHIKSGQLTIRDFGKTPPTPAENFSLTPYEKRNVLNVGGGPGSMPVEYMGWQQTHLDIDPDAKPDILGDARDILALIPENSQDNVFCSHNLEHYHTHEVPKVLSGFRNVLKDGGRIEIRVPDLKSVLASGKDINEVLYQSQAGPITVADVIWGFSKQIQAGNEFYAHKTGFNLPMLKQMIEDAGFKDVAVHSQDYELRAIAVR